MQPELYDLEADPGQETSLVDSQPETAGRLRGLWLDFLQENGASEARIRPFEDANVDANTPAEGALYAFRDDQGLWIAFPSEQAAALSAHRDNAPGLQRRVEKITFGQLLADSPKNLVHLFGQYYWADDLAS